MNNSNSSNLFKKVISQNQQGLLAPFIRGYVNYLKDNKYSTYTIYQFLNYVQQFSKYIELCGMSSFSMVSLTDAEKFVKLYNQSYVYRHKKPFKTKYHLSVLKHYIKNFLNYLHREKVIKLKQPDTNNLNYRNKIPSIMRDIVRDYINFIIDQQGLKKNTAVTYLSWIIRFTNFLKDKEIADLKVINITDIDEFMSKYTLKLSRASIYSMQSVLRSFIKHLYMFGYIDKDISIHILSAKAYFPRLVPRHTSWKNVRYTLKQIDTTSFAGKRLYAILVLFISYGLRPIEVSKLKITDLNFRKKEILVSDRKTRKNLLLPLTKDVIYGISAYLRVRPDVSNPALFVTANAPHKALSRMQMSKTVSQYLQGLGIKLPMNGPYIFRHSLAKRLLDKGVSITDISSILGHRSINSTMKYLKIDIKKLREVTDNYANLL